MQIGDQSFAAAWSAGALLSVEDAAPASAAEAGEPSTSDPNARGDCLPPRELEGAGARQTTCVGRECSHVFCRHRIERPIPRNIPTKLDVDSRYQAA